MIRKEAKWYNVHKSKLHTVSSEEEEDYYKYSYSEHNIVPLLTGC